MILFGILEIKLLTKKERIKKLIKDNNTLEAIKLCKNLYGVTLKEAVSIVKELKRNI